MTAAATIRIRASMPIAAPEWNAADLYLLAMLRALPRWRAPMIAVCKGVPR